MGVATSGAHSIIDTRCKGNLDIKNIANVATKRTRYVFFYIDVYSVTHSGKINLQRGQTARARARAFTLARELKKGIRRRRSLVSRSFPSFAIRGKGDPKSGEIPSRGRGRGPPVKYPVKMARSARRGWISMGFPCVSRPFGCEFHIRRTERLIRLVHKSSRTNGRANGGEIRLPHGQLIILGASQGS